MLKAYEVSDVQPIYQMYKLQHIYSLTSGQMGMGNSLNLSYDFSIFSHIIISVTRE